MYAAHWLQCTSTTSTNIEHSSSVYKRCYGCMHVTIVATPNVENEFIYAVCAWLPISTGYDAMYIWLHRYQLSRYSVENFCMSTIASFTDEFLMMGTEKEEINNDLLDKHNLCIKYCTFICDMVVWIYGSPNPKGNQFEILHNSFSNY